MAGFQTRAALQCAACGRGLGSPACIVDDSYFLKGKPAFLLQDLDLEGCPLSEVEKRCMRSGVAGRVQAFAAWARRPPGG